MKLSFRLVMSALLFTPVVCCAQAFKCRVDGKWTYQDYPCTNAPSQPVDVRPSSSGVTGLTEHARSMAAQERAQRARERELAAAEFAAREKKREEQRQRIQQAQQSQQTQELQKITELLEQQQRQQQQQQWQQLYQQHYYQPPSYTCRRNYFGGMECDPR